MGDRKAERRQPQSGRRWWRRLASWPSELYRYWRGKRAGWRSSSSLRRTAQPMPTPTRTEVRALVAAWHSKRQPVQSSLSRLSREEEALLANIRWRTAQANHSNVTRTAAYLDFYRRCPEVHWALLAHMVSRNGGWNMTDLQGELLPRLLTEHQRQQTYQMLERANGLIFGDAYPQLLLYELASQERCDMLRLLPGLGVSRFMEPIWAQFLEQRSSALLTTALIVNEQHFIESRVVNHSYYRTRVLDAFYFELQAALQFNQVVFPYSGEGEPLALAGLVLEDFTNIHERIEFGKRLYALLFSIPEVASGTLAFACRVPHSGSRADYAPHLFCRAAYGDREEARYRERLHALRLLEGASRLRSPELAQAWPERPLTPAEPGDWLLAVRPRELARYFRRLPLPRSFVMTNEYGFALDKLELAVLAAEQTGMTPLGGTMRN